MGRFLRQGTRAVPVLAMMLAGVAQTGVASAAPPPLGCASVIMVSTTLRSNVGPCTTDGLIVGASNVKLNLDGHKVFGAVTPGGGAAGQNAGVRFRTVSGAQVTNGEVTGFSVGVRIDGGSRNVVREVYAHDNIGPMGGDDNGDGISAWNSGNNTILSNRVVHNGPFSGIALVTGYYGPNDPPITAAGNVIADNEVRDNYTIICTSIAGCLPRDPNTGERVPESGRVARGFQTSADDNNGIRVDGPNEVNTIVKGNVVTGSAGNGILVLPSCHNTLGPPPAGGVRCLGDVGNINILIKDNQSDHNGYGRGEGSGINLFSMEIHEDIQSVIQPSYETVARNTARFNLTDGIELTTRCGAMDEPLRCAAHHNTLFSNVASDNRRNGITLEGFTSKNTVSQNTVNRNGNAGIELQLVTDFMVDPPMPAPGTGAFDNRISQNEGKNNMVDGVDATPGCGTNVWSYNKFGTASQPCVKRQS